MSSLSPIAQNPALSNLANLIFAANVSQLSLSPVSNTVNQNVSGDTALPIELDQAPQGIRMPTILVKPAHLNYLRDFRTQQCPLFANHKCTQHKPFTCFHWHFPNQRRRRPLRQADGTFTYSPDVYCDKYDETRGECPNGDTCPYLHRNAGDTERRYHLRYFKTGTCIHDTDQRGHCTRNGAHCAFAHGANDLRVPVYDVREVQEANESPVNLPASLEKERVLSEDPKWNDMCYVLANYKTDPCRKPPRMCRQGYACPFFHNSKDRRRGPQVCKYRSTPCPTVKSSEEWQDSSICEQGDDCQYCHTRTEQQFHPEIYKSTKCNDVMQQQYCPRGPFCAFAHEEAEMNFGRGFQQHELHALMHVASLQQQQLQQQQQQHQQQQQQQNLISRLISPNAWESVAVSPAGQHAIKGRSSSGNSLTSIESGVGSMYRSDSPVGSRLPMANQMRAAVAAASAAAAAAAAAASNGGGGAGSVGQLSPVGSSMLPDLIDDMDLSQQDFSCDRDSQLLSPLTVMTSSSNPIGIPGAHSPSFNPMSYHAANHFTEGFASVPFGRFCSEQQQQTSAAAATSSSAAAPPVPSSHSSSSSHTISSSRHRQRVTSGGSPASSSSFAQSPILMPGSPFANAGMDLERLQYQQEVSRAKREAAAMQHAMQLAQQERDEAQVQLEALRCRIREISSFAQKAPVDFSNCSDEEMRAFRVRLHHQLQSVQVLSSQQQQQQQLQQQTAAEAEEEEEEGEGENGLNLSSGSFGFSATLAAVAAAAAAAAAEEAAA